jgi:hypothetical protein
LRNAKSSKPWLRVEKAARIRRKNFFITQIYHAKPQSLKEEEKEIAFPPSFAPSRLCVNHTVTSPEAVTLEPPACRAQLGSGSISRLYPSVCVARWMLNRVVLYTPSAPA